MKNKVNTKSAKVIIANVADSSKEMAIKANDFALNITEGIITESIQMTAQWQEVADKAIKGGLKLAANQQDLIFDVLNEIKGHVKQGRNRFSRLVA